MQNSFRWPFLKPASPESWPRLVSAGVVLPPDAGTSSSFKRWVVSRSLCRFRHFSLSGIAAAQRRAVLRNLLLAWAPFDQSDYCVVMRGESAYAWAWDEAAAQLALREAGAPANAQSWPETLLREPSVADGLRVSSVLEGLDAQLWRHGELLASRWWPQAPDAPEWTRWCRALAVNPPLPDALDVPSVQSVGWRAPWAEGLGLQALLSSGSRLERLVIATGLVCLVGLSAAQAHLAWAAMSQTRALRDQVDSLTASAAPLIAARSRALVMQGEAELLAQQMSALQPLEVMQHLAERLPARGVLLKELELSGSKLRIALEATPDVARAALVKDLQATGWFEQVTEVRDSGGRGWLWFEMQVNGMRPPLGAVAQAAPRTPAAPAVAVPLPGARP